jgi:hypothetical protein
MNRVSKIAAVTGMALLMGTGLAGPALAGAGAPRVATVAVTSVSDESLDADLVYSRDEERMARDLYTLFGQTFDAPIFDRIAASEQQHYDAVGALLTTYGVADPAADQPAGTYATPRVQALYDQWKAQGLASEDAAIAVGVALEQADIADLEQFLAQNPQADVQQVFSHLLAASRHHLAAFTGAADGACTGAGRSGGRMADANGSDTRMRGTGMGAGHGMARTGR